LCPDLATTVVESLRRLFALLRVLALLAMRLIRGRVWGKGRRRRKVVLAVAGLVCSETVKIYLDGRKERGEVNGPETDLR
jgi:hypothetical protein